MKWSVDIGDKNMADSRSAILRQQVRWRNKSVVRESGKGIPACLPPTGKLVAES